METHHRARPERLARADSAGRARAHATLARAARSPRIEVPLTRPRHRCLRLAAALLAAVVSGACTVARLYTLPRLPRCSGPIPSSETLPAGDFVWRDRVRYRAEAVDAGFALVAEKRASRLVLVGLDAFGVRAFSVIQEGGRIETDPRLGRALEVPPETVLRDWHAARAAGSDAPGRFELARPECGYRVSFVVEGRAALPPGPRAIPAPGVPAGNEAPAPE